MKYFDVLGLLRGVINSTPGIEIRSVMEPRARANISDELKGPAHAGDPTL